MILCAYKKRKRYLIRVINNFGWADNANERKKSPNSYSIENVAIDAMRIPTQREKNSTQKSIRILMCMCNNQRKESTRTDSTTQQPKQI